MFKSSKNDMFKSFLKFSNKEEKNQVEKLRDISGSGCERPWKSKKMANMELAKIYYRVDIGVDERGKSRGEKKAVRLEKCAVFLVFALLTSGRKRLKKMSSCRVRLCPVCNWRRGLKIFYHMKKIMEYMEKHCDYRYIMVTFTVRNCEGDKLSGTIDKMLNGFNRMMSNNKQVKRVVKGYYRGFEVTRNKENGTYHPHIHCIFAVYKSYFTESESYITQKQFSEYWQEYAKLEYVPIVDVRKIYGTTVEAVSEVAKYAVKEGDYVIPEDVGLSVEIVGELDGALHKRRFVAYGGEFKRVHKELNLDDTEGGDLVEVGEEESCGEDNGEEVYVWCVGYVEYVRGVVG